MESVEKGRHNMRRRAVTANHNVIGTGFCDFCRQRNVKLKLMNCKLHVYCSVCEEFCPKLRQNRFKCKKCSDKRRQTNADNLKKVDDFLSNQSGLTQTFQELTISMDGTKVLSFGEEECENDQSGDSLEWDFLLQPSEKPAPDFRASVENKKPKEDKSSQNMNTPYDDIASGCQATIGREQSFLKLVLPSTKRSASASSGYLEVSSGEETVLEYETRNSGYMCGYYGEMEEDCERGSSPIKRPEQMSDESWVGLTTDNNNDSEDDFGSNFPYHIEGPSYSDSSDSEAESFCIQKDDFWDV